MRLNVLGTTRKSGSSKPYYDLILRSSSEMWHNYFSITFPSTQLTHVNLPYLFNVIWMECVLTCLTLFRIQFYIFVDCFSTSEAKGLTKQLLSVQTTYKLKWTKIPFQNYRSCFDEMLMISQGQSCHLIIFLLLLISVRQNPFNTIRAVIQTVHTWFPFENQISTLS